MYAMGMDVACVRAKPTQKRAKDKRVSYSGIWSSNVAGASLRTARWVRAHELARVRARVYARMCV
jgi:hypothetical protein